MWDWVQSAPGNLDSWVASQAAKRASSNKAAGVARNVSFVEGAQTDGDRKKVIERITRGMSPGAGQAVPGAGMESQIEALLQSKKGRQQVAREYSPTMRRGPGEFTGRGFMEMVNEGIAGNAYVRRGVLPTAVVGGGALMTAGAQQLLALMGFMQEGSQTGERTENSPLA